MVEAGSAVSGHGAAFVSPHCGSSVTEARSGVSAPRAWATSHDDQLLTGATVHAATVDWVSSSVLHHDLDARLQRLESTPTGQLKTIAGQKLRTKAGDKIFGSEALMAKV